MYTEVEKFAMPLLFLIMLSITILLWLALRNKSDTVKSIPFIVITVLLIGGELAKQIICKKTGYQYWDLPLHFCSTYFIWFSLAEFSVGKMRKCMQNVAFVATIYLVGALYSSPRGILSDALESPFAEFRHAHTIIFHHLVILYSMLFIALRHFEPKKMDALVWILCFSIYLAVTVFFAYRLNTNFFNILNSESMPLLEPYRLAVGQLVYNATLGAIVIFVGAIILFVSACIGAKCTDDEFVAVGLAEEGQM